MITAGGRFTLTVLMFVGCAFWLAPEYQAEANDNIYARSYYGDAIDGITDSELAAFNRGFSLFVRNWGSSNNSARNALSCVSCHSVPMPGGSGMSEQAVVSVKTVSDKTEVIQRQDGNSSNHVFGKRVLTRRTPSLFGIGLLEFATKRYIAGVPQPIFGAFAEEVSLSEFVSRAFAVELGVSTPTFCARENIEQNYPLKCVPIVTQSEVDDVSSFIRFLAAPPKSNRSMSFPGAVIFSNIGCSGCHIPSLKTSGEAPLALRDKQFEVYTDLRTHDIGFEHSIRTAPLWGLNSLGPPYLHNASAQNIEAAVVSHAGEAKTASERYSYLSQSDKDALMEFLKSL